METRMEDEGSRKKEPGSPKWAVSKITKASFAWGGIAKKIDTRKKAFNQPKGEQTTHESKRPSSNAVKHSRRRLQ